MISFLGYFKQGSIFTILSGNKVWKQKEDVTSGIFRERVQARAVFMVDEPSHARCVWKVLKECLLDYTVEVCRETKGIACIGGGMRRVQPW